MSSSLCLYRIDFPEDVLGVTSEMLEKMKAVVVSVDNFCLTYFGEPSDAIKHYGADQQSQVVFLTSSSKLYLRLEDGEISAVEIPEDVDLSTIVSNLDDYILVDIANHQITSNAEESEECEDPHDEEGDTDTCYDLEELSDAETEDDVGEMIDGSTMVEITSVSAPVVTSVSASSETSK